MEMVLAEGFHRMHRSDHAGARGPRAATPKIIAHDPAQDEPPCAQCALYCSADLRCSNPWVVADGNFENAISRDRPLQNQFDRPAIGGFLEAENAHHVSARGSKRAKVSDLHAIEKPDQPRREPISKSLMPRQRMRFTLGAKTRPQCDVSAAFDDRSKQQGEFRRPVAVVSVQEYKDVRVFRIRNSS